MTISKHNLVTKTRLNSLVKEFGANNLKTDGKILLCIFCHIPVNPKKASYITQHFSSQKHIKAVENNSISPTISNASPTFVQEANFPLQKQFSSDICESMICSNIPLYKLESRKFRLFLQKYTSYTIPSRSTISNQYIKPLYDQKIASIQNKFKNQYLWLSVDETTDSAGNHATIILAGILNN